MKESYDEGIASHIGPESCASIREGGGEALTGVPAGRVWSREILFNFRVLTLWDRWTETPYAGTGRSRICLQTRGVWRSHREV
jgi:RNA-directed DNA polymerase